METEIITILDDDQTQTEQFAGQKRTFEDMTAETNDIPMIDLVNNDENTNNNTETEQIILSEPQPKRRKLNENMSTLNALAETADLSDITFQIENKQFFGLKALFAIKSGVFRTLLYPSNGTEMRFIQITDISVTAFAFIREFIYDLKPELSLQNVVDVLNASKRYDIGLIQKQCITFLNGIDTVSDLLSVLCEWKRSNGALDTELNNLLKSNNHLLKTNGNEIINSDTFKSLPFSMAKHFIANDDLSVKEEHLWQNSKHWFASNGNALKQIIRFCRMETQFIFEEIKSLGVLTDGDLCSIYEMKLGLNQDCRFNCQQRFEEIKKRARSRRGRKKKEPTPEIEENEEMAVEESEAEPTPVKPQRKSRRGRKKKAVTPEVEQTEEAQTEEPQIVEEETVEEQTVEEVTPVKKGRGRGRGRKRKNSGSANKGRKKSRGRKKK